MNRVEAREEYLRAWKRAQKDYREKMAAGQYPYLPVLDDILQSANVESQLPIGTVEVPLELLVGTKTAGRTAAFASNFMPLLEPDTEFASKWISLCQAHVEEGIRDPIRCFEYLGRFYVQEGNKRVSVLKYFEADSISATVTRVMPQYSDNKEIRLYYEFVEYYPLCGLYTLTFTQEGSFARLQKALGKAPGEKWSDDDRADIVSLYNWIKKSYHARGGENMRTTVGDVLLLLIRVYTLADLKKRSPAELTKALDAIWDDVLAIEQPVPVKLSTKPAEPDQVKLIDRILPAAIRPGAAPKNLQVAFVHERTPETSTWTSQHEFGRSQLDQVFPGQVKTKAYYNAVSGENADELVEQAIAEGADIVFTTSPKLVGASLRAALKHPDIRILNCSVDMPYTGIRTYYTRVYEAKFISGAIAGAMSSGDRIGYVADYPNFGAPANINAFALGARMVNPRVRVDLQWTCLPDANPLKTFMDQGITVVSGRDTPAPGHPQREFGIFRIRRGGMLEDLASPFWHWGQFYENVVRSVLNGAWSKDAEGGARRAVNYWWGMNSGVMDVLFSRELPHDVRHLANILRQGIISGAIDPFACHIIAQDGTLMNEGHEGFAPEQILHMDWLCDAIDGHIPEFDELSEAARPMYRMQGIHKDRLPVEKEADL